MVAWRAKAADQGYVVTVTATVAATVTVTSTLVGAALGLVALVGVA